MTKSVNSSDGYRKYIGELEALFAEQGWDLKKYFRSTWCAFKPAEHGKSAFGIGHRSDGAPYLYIKRVYREANGFSIPMTAYDEINEQVEYDLEASPMRLETFLQLLTLAYQSC